MIVVALISLLLISFMTFLVIERRIGKFIPMIAFLLFIIIPLTGTAIISSLAKTQAEMMQMPGFVVILILAHSIVFATYKLGLRLYAYPRFKQAGPFVPALALIAATFSAAVYYTVTVIQPIVQS